MVDYALEFSEEIKEVPLRDEDSFMGLDEDDVPPPTGQVKRQMSRDTGFRGAIKGDSFYGDISEVPLREDSSMSLAEEAPSSAARYKRQMSRDTGFRGGIRADIMENSRAQLHFNYQEQKEDENDDEDEDENDYEYDQYDDQFDEVSLYDRYSRNGNHDRDRHFGTSTLHSHSSSSSSRDNSGGMRTRSDSVFRSTARNRLGGRSNAMMMRGGGQHGGSNVIRHYAMRSIRRGSDEWRNMIKPFVADLAFQSVVGRRFTSTVTFEPYHCQAAVLFVDLSGYSKITAAIAHKGAHALSSTVNAYLSRLLKLVHAHGGDVLKFAGDAVLVAFWSLDEELQWNVVAAAQCAIALQKHAGSHVVEGTNLAFRIHVGLACGNLESDIFEAPRTAHMQRLYHSVGGHTLDEIGDLVDMAKAGEICISSAVYEQLENYCEVTDYPGHTAKILTKLDVEEDLVEDVEKHIERILFDRLEKRNRDIEEGFIHPTVLDLLTHGGGMSPTQIAQMRNLCVFFIAMTSKGSSLNWLMEVQSVLDKKRCPIVQIIDDDKGVHIIAAINLYESVPETTVLGLDICRELVEKQVGSAIGVAMGSTFCGVTGSANIACRWDITGAPVVRAARLMQYATAHNLELAIDHSVYQDKLAATRMTVLHEGIDLKGTKDPVPVYGLSGAKDFSALKILETVHGCIHDDQVRQIRDCISVSRRRVAIVVTGPHLVGKKIACQRAAGYADMVPFLHVSSEPGGLLQLARSMAIWFRHVDDDEVEALAIRVLEHLDSKRWTRAHDQCVELVTLALEKGHRACFVVDSIQFLDEFSMSLMRECLVGRHHSRKTWSTDMEQGDISNACMSPLDAKICFLCVHQRMFHWPPAAQMAKRIARSHRDVTIPVVEIPRADEDQLRTLFRDTSDMEVHERWMETYGEASGMLPGYFMQRAAASRILSGKLWSQGLKGYAITTNDLVLQIPTGMIRRNRLISVSEVSIDVAMKYTALYDELPPIMQTLCKVLALGTKGSYFQLPQQIMWEVLNDLIADGVDEEVLDAVVQDMIGMYLLVQETVEREERLSFVNPALGDVVFDVCTPVQIQSIATALMERLRPRSLYDHDANLVLAHLLHVAGMSTEEIFGHWTHGYTQFLEASEDWPSSRRSQKLEYLDEEITELGYDPFEVLGPDFTYEPAEEGSVGNKLPLLKIYDPPIAFGPMADSLTVIFRNAFQEYKNFYGARRSTMTRLRMSFESSSTRYLKQLDIIEEMLSTYGCGATDEHLAEERDLIRKFAAPATSAADVQEKARVIVDEFIDRFLVTRVSRLECMMQKVRGEEIPKFLRRAHRPIRRAYEILRQADYHRNDAAHDALMTMATMNWKPRAIPEYLPANKVLTLARMRDKILGRLTEAELIIYRHQHTVDDFECYLITTAKLNMAQDIGLC